MVGAEAGVQRMVQTAAVLLWIPAGFVFWIPYLLRQTASYVLSVLYAGLTGGEPERARARWTRSVAFYRLGFQRIVHAFDSGETPPAARSASPAGRRGGMGRFLFEVAWSALVWGAALWLLGLWPEAPEVARATAVRAWEGAGDALLQLDRWVQQLLRRG